MSSELKARAREALTDPNNLDLALHPEPLVRDLLLALDVAHELLAVFSDNEPCQFDHHGNCQAHNMFDFRPEFTDCPMILTRREIGGA